MTFRTRLHRLLREVPSAGWCPCPMDQMIVRYPDDPETVEADARDADGRPVCGRCGLPQTPGARPQIVILMPVPKGDALAR
jgi:hypothetical protein